jgi:hypothetical protein
MLPLSLQTETPLLSFARSKPNNMLWVCCPIAVEQCSLVFVLQLPLNRAAVPSSYRSPGAWCPLALPSRVLQAIKLSLRGGPVKKGAGGRCQAPASISLSATGDNRNPEAAIAPLGRLLNAVNILHRSHIRQYLAW